MSVKRIVSFLPSATELLYEFEVQDSLYGITNECKYPHDAILKPQVISSVINSDELTSKEIDTVTCKLLKDGQDIFVLNEKNLKDANPDLIISQETCEVCAAYTSHVNKAIDILQRKPLLHSMDPHNMDEILDSVRKLGKILGKETKANQIVDALDKRIAYIKENPNDKSVKVLAIEWIEPFFTAGHWIPEMIQIAGGENMISMTGEHSRRLTLDEIAKSNPDVIIFMPCGFNVHRTVTEYEEILKNDKKWNLLNAVKNDHIFAVDANSFFSKPSIRTVNGIEILAKIIQPEKFTDLQVSNKSFVKMGRMSI
jgi:iron complex transport system substrate-binding protein